MNLRVLQIYKDFDPPVKGGIEGHLNLLARGIKQRGIDVSVLVSNTKPFLKTESIDGISIFKVPQLTRLSSAPINPTLFWWFRKLADQFDIFHFHLPNPTAVVSYLLAGLRKKVVVTYHSDIVRQKQLAKLYSPFSKYFLDRADVIIATSPKYIQSSKILNCYKSKCRVVPLGIDTTRFNRNSEFGLLAENMRRRRGSRLILFVGKFRYYKGLEILIEAMKKVDGHLLLVGSGKQERRLKAQTSAAGLGHKVSFLGEVSDDEVVVYLKSCDVLVLPSNLRSEAFGIVQLEAMACGKPVISTELETGTSYVNVHGETGLVVPPNNATALGKPTSPSPAWPANPSPPEHSDRQCGTVAGATRDPKDLLTERPATVSLDRARPCGTRR